MRPWCEIQGLTVAFLTVCCRIKNIHFLLSDILKLLVPAKFIYNQDWNSYNESINQTGQVIYRHQLTRPKLMKREDKENEKVNINLLRSRISVIVGGLQPGVKGNGSGAGSQNGGER